MPKKPPKTIYRAAKYGRLAFDPDIVPEVAAYLLLWLARAESAARTQKRMMVTTEDGTQTTNPAYYEHASGYLRHMLYRLPGTMPAADLAEAMELWQRSQEPKPATPPSAHGEG